MARLRDLIIPTQEVKLPGIESTLTVRGLSTADCVSIYRKHESALEGFLSGEAGKDDLSPEGLIERLVSSAPKVVVDVIACAAGDPSSAEVVEQISFPGQMLALTKIMEMTFHSEEDAKKFLQTIVGAGSLVSRLMESINQNGQ